MSVGIFYSRLNRNEHSNAIILDHDKLATSSSAAIRCCLARVAIATGEIWPRLYHAYCRY